ncbi:MAG: hypothetical protein JO197_07400 [Acidobacteria bacterium]|nr:hypothetical protein [Acidobacteriota bacterium]MBV9475784.1 hypothetical protein [Acidobacteriota bacterium]
MSNHDSARREEDALACASPDGADACSTPQDADDDDSAADAENFAALLPELIVDDIIDAPTIENPEHRCPSTLELRGILENHDRASRAELQHIALCPDCVARTRAFRDCRHEDAETLFTNLLDAVLAQSDRSSPHVEWGERYARLLFYMIGEDDEFERWQRSAWRCSHTLAYALRHAREDGANAGEMHAILELLFAAYGAAISNRLGAPAHLFDGAWPLAEMIREAAFEIRFASPASLHAFARAATSATELASPRMQAMILYTVAQLPASDIADALVRELEAANLDAATRPLLRVLFGNQVELLPDSASHARRDLLRATDALHVIAASGRDAAGRIQALARRLATTLFATPEPVEALVRLVMFRAWLRELGATLRGRAEAASIVRNVARLLVDLSAERYGSTFLAIEACAVIRDFCPGAFVSLASDVVASARPVVRHGLVVCAAEGYESSLHARPHGAHPLFRRRGRTWIFEGGAEAHPLDVFGHALAAAATNDAEVLRHLIWLHERMRGWRASG